MFAVIVAATFAAGPVRAQEPGRETAKKIVDAAGVSRAKGAETATVRVYEIADFQCPFCAKFATDVMPKLDSAFVRTGKVQWVFVNMPLPMHQNAWIAAETAMCAGATNKFWAMHDRLYRSQAEWAQSQDPTPIFARYAKEIGVAAEPYTSCIMGDRVATLITNDVIFAATARITGTPTFVINDEETIVGMKTYEEWKDLLEAAMKKAAAKKN
jgi:protein-disulfide isomerase